MSQVLAEGHLSLLRSHGQNTVYASRAATAYAAVLVCLMNTDCIFKVISRIQVYHHYHLPITRHCQSLYIECADCFVLPYRVSDMSRDAAA